MTAGARVKRPYYVCCMVMCCTRLSDFGSTVPTVREVNESATDDNYGTTAVVQFKKKSANVEMLSEPCGNPIPPFYRFLDGATPGDLWGSSAGVLCGTFVNHVPTFFVPRGCG